jgi:hypothetical protein
MSSFNTPKSDMTVFVAWINGGGLPKEMDLPDWLIRCESWIKTQMTKEGLLDASQGSNS